MNRRDDRDSVLRVLAGDAQAFASLVDRHQRAAMSVALARCGRLADAEDIVQEAFVLAYSRLAKLREPAAFGGWLMQIVIRLAASRKRTVARDESARRRLSSVGDEPQTFDEIGDRERRLIEAVEALPRGLRDVVVMRYFEERSVGEISELTGRQSEAVKRQLTRAHQRLRKILIAEVPHG